MKIMDIVYSGLSALRTKVEGNDAAIHARVLRDLNSLSAEVHNAEMPQDHDHEAAVADTEAARDAAALSASQLQDHLDKIEAAPRAGEAVAVTDEDRAAHLAQMQPGVVEDDKPEAPADDDAGDDAAADPAVEEAALAEDGDAKKGVDA